MSRLACNRLLQTCVNNSGAAFLVAGAPFYVRSPWGLRAGRVPPLTADDIGQLVSELSPGVSAVQPIDGFFIFDAEYVDNHRFRVAVFGGPLPSAAIITEIPRAVPPLEPNSNWKILEPGLTIRTMLQNCVRQNFEDLILINGYTPLMRSPVGVHAFCIPPISADEIARAVQEILSPPEYRHELDGYLAFDVWHGSREAFRTAVFGYPSPTAVIMMRLPLREAKQDGSPSKSGGGEMEG